jgi:hypothetical protein
VVVIAEATRRLLGNLFEFQDLGAKKLKGIAGPETAPILLQRMSPFVARNGPPAMADLSPLTGAKRTICARSEYFAF